MSTSGTGENATLARGLELLQYFGAAQPLLGNAELAARSGLQKATVARLTYTLTELGYLRRDAKLRKFRLGPAILMVGYPLLASMEIRQVARPFMKELATEVDGIVGLGVHDRADMVYVEAAHPLNAPPPYIDRGTTVPVVSSAIGRAWLSKAPTSERERAINQARLRDPALFAANASRVQKAVRELDTLGYCVSRGHLSPSRWAVAVPLRAAIGGELYVFNCAISEQGVSVDSLVGTMGPLLVEMVRRLEAAMGMA